MLSEAIRQSVEQFIRDGSGDSFSILNSRSIGGGSINDAYKITGDNQASYFLKVNSASAYPGMFQAEQQGLQLLRESKAIFTPEVYGIVEAKEEAGLLMEWVESGNPNPNFWEEFGQQLADMHRNSQKNFGLGHNNYIGSLPQSNSLHDNWVDFFVVERIQLQLKMAHLPEKLNTQFDFLFGKLADIFPEEPPALLHGDLWSGNYMSNAAGNPCIFDPAVYYGHREMDIAMTQLFGGFSKAFYQAYNNAWPMANGWQNRMDICNLYPLLVHVNLFGGGYLQQVKSILNRYT